MTKKFLTLAFLAVAAAAGIYAWWSSRPAVEVYLAKRGTATYAIYGTVKVDPMFSFSVHARSGGVLKLSELLAKTNNLIGFPVTNGEKLGEVVNESLERDYAKALKEYEAA